MATIRSPLRYPGGKSKALKKILPIIPNDYKEFRDVMVGGGSVFLSSKQTFCNGAKYKINDLNYDLYCFWKQAKCNIFDFVKRVKEIKEKETDGKELFKKLSYAENYTSEIERAIRFFVLNRITFSGTVDCGGYSSQSFKKRFTWSSIDRLFSLSGILADVDITCNDYEDCLFDEGSDVFIFLDPPYYSSVNSKLYGKKGDLHIDFDYNRLASNLKKCKHKWLMTIDNVPEVREMFAFANIFEWELYYSMSNKKGKEIFVTNL